MLWLRLQWVMECSIIDNLLFSYHVPLKIRLDLNVDHMFERKYCHRLAWHKTGTERIDQYRSDLEYKLSTTKGHCRVRMVCVKNMLMNYLDYIMRY